MEKNIAMLEVKCIKTRNNFPNQIIKGQRYILDRMTVWMDEDGDAFGMFYDMNGNRIGQLLLSHFSCL